MPIQSNMSAVKAARQHDPGVTGVQGFYEPCIYLLQWDVSLAVVIAPEGFVYLSQEPRFIFYR